MDWLVATVAGGVCVVAGLRHWQGRRRERSVLLPDTLPEPRPGSLSPRLDRLIHQARYLRLVIETPIRRIQAPLLPELPWVRRAYCDEYDAAVVELRREVWDWLREVDLLPDADTRLLRELGFSLRPFRRIVYRQLDRTEDTWEEVLWRKTPDLDEVAAELRAVAQELDRLLSAFAALGGSPYRALAASIA